MTVTLETQNSQNNYMGRTDLCLSSPSKGQRQFQMDCGLNRNESDNVPLTVSPV